MQSAHTDMSTLDRVCGCCGPVCWHSWGALALLWRPSSARQRCRCSRVTKPQLLLQLVATHRTRCCSGTCTAVRAWRFRLATLVDFSCGLIRCFRRHVLLLHTVNTRMALQMQSVITSNTLCSATFARHAGCHDGRARRGPCSTRGCMRVPACQHPLDGR